MASHNKSNDLPFFFNQRHRRSRRLMQQRQKFAVRPKKNTPPMSAYSKTAECALAIALYSASVPCFK